MKKRQIVSLILTAALAVGLVTGCGNTDSDSGTANTESGSSSVVQDVSGTVEESATQADKVVVAVDDDSFTIAPWGSEGSVRDWTEKTVWAHLCYRPFIGAMLENDELQMNAAKSVTKVDDSTYEVELFDNITDSKGNSITASDVVFSYDKLKELGFVSEISLYYDSAEATDDYKVTIKLADTSEGAIEAVLCDCSIVNQAWYEGASDDEINSDPATTGAYAVTDVQAGSSVTLEARDYWKSDDKSDVEFQNVKTIELRCITEASSRAIALENGEVDMAEISSDDVSRFEDNADYNVTTYLNAMTQYLIFNCDESNVCSDVNVRKAIAYAFDAYNMSLSAGECVMSHDVAPNLGPDYVQAWDNEDYFAMDLEKSAEYLEAAGYAPGELEVSLLVSSQAPQQPYVALQSMLEEAGITLTIDAQDRAARQAVQNDVSAWDMSEYSNQVVDFTTTYWNDLFGGDSQCFVKDSKLTELLAAATADRSEENMTAFHDYIIDQAYIVGVYTETRHIVTAEGVTNVSLEKLNPVLNAMAFAEDYASVAN